MTPHTFRVLDGSERIRMIEGELQPVAWHDTLDAQYRVVECPRCGAPVGEWCADWCEVRDGYDSRKDVLRKLKPVTFRSLDDYTRGGIKPITWRESVAHIPTLASKFRRGGGEI